MKILVINCGSSSLKYQLFDMDNEEVLGKGIVERIGIDGSRIKHEVNGEKLVQDIVADNHTQAIEKVFEVIT
ncbi:MAG: acetate kinase, partial [Gallicola sp.]|nr:acetate kinase [Gallicola sp.]